MRRITWLGTIFCILIGLSVFLPQYPDVAHATTFTQTQQQQVAVGQADPNILTITPDSDVSIKWTPKSGGSNYVEVNEITHDDDTSYVSTAKQNKVDQYGLDNHTTESGGISQIKMYIWCYQTGAENLKIGIISGAITDTVTITPGSTWTEYTNTWTKNPDDGLDWEWTDIDALQAYIKSRNVGGWSGTQYVTQIYYEVTYTPLVISITLTDTGTDGIHFGSLEPATTDNPDLDQSESNYSIRVNVEPETTVNVDLQIKGTDFSGTFTVGNAKYSLTYGGAKNVLSTTYATFAENVAPDNSQDLWHWLNVPGGTAPGSYTSTFYYQAIKSGG